MNSAPDFHLSPLTRHKLAEFGRRRRRLILFRGLFAAVASLLGAMLLIAIPDYLFVLSDTARWVLSTLAYGAAVAAVWITSLRLMVHIPSQRELAQWMETTEPGLHEDLVAAVELGAADADPRFDSPVFRGLLQQSVAERMGRLDVQALLPWALVRWWARAAGIVLVICLALVLIPDSPFRALLTRAMLPGANVGRVSDTIVNILEPTARHALVPQGEAVRIVVELEGEDADRVLIELSRQDGEAERLEMLRQEGRRFAATLQMAEDPVQYRIRAGDALTARYTIDTRPRPYVTQFAKTYTYPPYTTLPQHTVTEKSGDLEAIEQTQVELTLTTDQPIVEASLHIEQGSETQRLPLTLKSPTQLAATVPLERTGAYRVHLVAAQTKFENKFSPRYALIATPDLVPRVEITAPRPAAGALLPPDEIVGLRGQAEDDLGLKEVRQLVRVNGGRWEPLPLPSPNGKQYAVERAWDLLDLKLKAGDRLVTKLVATDLKGSIGESDPLAITIAAPGFDADRLSYLEAKVAAAKAMRRLVEVTDAQRRIVDEAVEKLLRSEANDAQNSVYVVNTRAAVQQIADEADRALRLSLEALGRMRRGVDAHDLTLAARVLARIRYEQTAAAVFKLHHAEAVTERDERQRRLRTVQNEVREAHSLAQTLINRYADAVAAEVTAVATDDLRALVEQQQRLAPDGFHTLRDEALTWKLLARREGVAVNQLLGLEQLFIGYAEYFEGGDRRRLEEYSKRLARERELLEPKIAAETPDRGIVAEAQQLRTTLEQLHREIKAVQAEHSRKLDAARRQLANAAPDTHQIMMRLPDELAALNRHLERQRNPKRQPKERDQRKHEEERAELLQLRWPMAIEMGKARAAIEEARPDANAQFVAESGAMGRTLDAMLLRHHTAEAAQDLETTKEIEQQLRHMTTAYRQLEAVHQIVEAATVTAALAEGEKWKVTTPQAHTQHPRQWDLTEQQLELASRSVREAQLLREAADLLGKIRGRPYAAEVRRELNERRNQVRDAQKIDDPLALVQADIRTALALLVPQIAEARAALKELSPDLDELMRIAAERARQMQQQTQAAAEAPHIQPEQNQQQMTELGARQAQVDSAVADVMDALRQDANLQNPFSEEGRERARDADDATAMIRDPANRAQQAMQAAADAQDANQQAANLQQVAQQHERLAHSLDQAAQHFEKLDAGESVAQSRQQMRDSERELGIDQGLDEQYEQMEQLSEMAQLSPRELLQRLEQELAQNRSVQRELSDVSRNTLEQARSQLEHAAATERQQADRLQQAEQLREQMETQLAQQLQQMRQAAKELAQRDLPKAAQTAEVAGLQPQRDVIEQARQRAAEVARKLPAAAQTQASPELGRQLQTQVEPLTQTARELREAAQQAAAAQTPHAAQSVESAQAAADQATKAAEAAQQGAREAQAAAEQLNRRQPNTPQTNRAMQAAQEAAGAAYQAKQDAERAGSFAQLAQTRAQQEHGPAVTQAAQEALRGADQAMKQADASAKAAAQVAHELAQAAERLPALNEAHQQATAAAEQMQARAAQDAAAMQQAQTKMQPAQRTTDAQAAAQQAADRAAQLAGQIKSLADAMTGAQKQSEQAMQAAAAAQQPIQTAVADAAQDVMRSARHEQRMNNAEAAKSIDRAAAMAQQTAEQDVPAAARQLKQVAQPAAAHPALQQVGEAIAESAKMVSAVLDGGQEVAGGGQMSEVRDQSADAPSQDSGLRTQNSSPLSGTAFEGQSTQWLARALDELDQSLFGQQQGGDNGAQGALAQAADAADQSPGDGVPQHGPGQPSPAQSSSQGGTGEAPSGSEAMTAAAQAQAQAMAQQRQGGMVPGQNPLAQGFAEKSDKGAAVETQSMPYTALPGADRSADADWGKLPPQLARDLMEGRRENVSGEYRNMVETYFRAIAEKAQSVK